MILYSYPPDFSSIFADNYYRFEDVEQNSSTEVEFRLGSGFSLGTRRFAGRSTITTSPKSLLRRAINPQPLPSGDKCELLSSEGRCVAIYALYDNRRQTSPTLHFTASHSQLSVGEVMGGANQSRLIARDESDEVAVVVNENSAVMVEAHLSDGSSATLISERVPTTGVWVARIVADDVLHYATEPQEVEWFRLVVSVGGVEAATLHYTLVEHPRGAVRLAWLNPDGYIHYHTFAPPLEQRTLSSRSECQLPDGTVALAVEGWQELLLGSGYLSTTNFDRLREIACSPRVWLIEDDGTPIAQRVTSSEVYGDTSSGYRLSVRIRPAKATTYW